MMMTSADHAIQLALSVVLIVGAYQFYFWCQRHPLRPAGTLALPVDEWIPYRPGWVWIYSGLYYPAILYTALTVRSPRHFTYLALSYLLLLAGQMAFFLCWPVETPPAWRAGNRRRTWSERFLALVQRLDHRSNSFPSMHTSVAMLTALHAAPALGGWAFVFPLLIGLSCLFTKQHFLVDVPSGAALGWAVFHVAPVAW